MIRAVIFDYFGVIQPETIPAAYRRFGGDPAQDAEFIRSTVHAANLGLIPRSRDVFARRLGVSVEEWIAAVNEIPQDANLLDYIKKLKGKYKTGLLSNVSRGALAERFAPDSPVEYFDAALGSGDVGIAKPDPRIYRIMAERLGVAPAECVFIDDKPEYCAAARAVGMQAIVYKDFTQFKLALEKLLAEAGK